MSISGDIAHNFMYDIAFILQVNHIFMKKKISLNKESNNFAIVSFQMLKLPQSTVEESPPNPLPAPGKKSSGSVFFFALTPVHSKNHFN